MIQSRTLDVRKTEAFERWLSSLRDMQARTRVVTRIRLLGEGHIGDAKALGDGVSELRIHAGPGYRIYFARVGDQLVFLLAGGDKSTQTKDVARAKALAAALRKGTE